MAVARAATASALAFVVLPSSSRAAGKDWLPPKPVSAIIPSATLAPGQPRVLEFLLRANGAPANLRWTATPGGTAFVPILSATQGTVSLAADQTLNVPLTVTVPAGHTGVGSGFITLRVFYEPGGGTAVNPQQVAMIAAANQGRPQLYPLPSTLTAPAGAPTAVTYELRSTIAGSEQFHLSVTRANPDENNAGLLFPRTGLTTPVTLPGMGTLQIAVPVTPPGNAYPGNVTSFALTAGSDSDDDKVVDCKGHAFLTSPDPDSLPTSFHPVGMVPQEQIAAGRDGPTPLPGRNLWLVPSGPLGVRVLRDSALNQVGKIDRNVNGLDDRLVGTIRVPTYAAAIAVVPGFVNSAQQVLDLGLLAAGRSGLMLVDLRDIVDPPFGSWEDFYDVDGNGIDDRIVRMIPIPGFATDVEWFHTSEGRVVALVAAADTGSTPVAVGYDPALTTPGTGAGIVAVDVGAALDSLPGVPFMAGSQATPGSALDLEVRGGEQPDLAVADGTGGVAFFDVSATGEPAAVTFTSQGAVALDATWGTPHARDLAWTPGDSLYLAVASALGGIQLLNVPLGSSPFLALAQRTDSVAIAVATAEDRLVAAAMGPAGATILKLPTRGQLDLISPAAAPPYQAPVVLGLGASWTEGRPLKVGYHGTLVSSFTSMRFKIPSGGEVPDLLCADGARTLVIRPGGSALVGVGDPRPLATLSRARLLVSPNPVRERAELRVYGDGLTPMEQANAGWGPTEFTILDLQGRLVRRLQAPPPAGFDMLAGVSWDGRDRHGLQAAPGNYWVLATRRGGWSARSAFVVVR